MIPTNWQTKFSSVRERTNYALSNSLFCDVEFSVVDCSGAKVTIHANKYILAISSPVFEAMFYGELVDRKPTVELSDCTKEGLYELLRYVYSDEVNLTANNVMELLYLAEKYLMPFLVEKCKKYLQDNVKPEDVMRILPQVQKLGDKELQKHLMRVVDRETHRAVTSEPFVNIPRDLLSKILVRDTLNIKELDLFRAVDRWAEQRIKEKAIESTGKTKRSILGEFIIRQIRFPLMEMTDFTEVVIPCEVLKRNELTELFLVYSGRTPETQMFSSKQRVLPTGAGSLLIPRLRFDDISVFLMDYDGVSKDAISFTVSKSFFLVGVRFFGGQASTYRVKLQIYKLDQAIAHLSSCFHTEKDKIDDTYYGYTVNLEKPVTLDPNIVYTVEAIISGARSLAGSHGEATITVEDLTLTYINSPSSDRTTTRKGQFPTLIFQKI